MIARKLLLCPICDSGTGAQVRAGIASSLAPLAALAIVGLLLALLAAWVHFRAPVRAWLPTPSRTRGANLPQPRP